MAKAVSPKALVTALQSKFGDESAMIMGDAGTGVKSVCPTGIAVLDRWTLGVGGAPYGRIIEISGGESSGKTTLMNKLLAGVQNDGGTAVLAEVEHTYDPAWAKLHGVDVDKLVLMQPDYLDGEGGTLVQFEYLIENSKGPILIALDSVAASQSKREFEEGLIGDPGMAELARAWSQGLRRLNPIIARRQAILVLVNQTRSNVGVMYGPKTTTPGGNAIKFYASVRLSVGHGQKVDNGLGRLMSVLAVKNKVAVPYRSCNLKMIYSKGFDERWNIMNHAKDRKVVPDSCRSYKDAIAALGWSDLPMPDSIKAEAVEASLVEMSSSEEGEKVNGEAE